MIIVFIINLHKDSNQITINQLSLFNFYIGGLSISNNTGSTNILIYEKIKKHHQLLQQRLNHLTYYQNYGQFEIFM